MSASSQDATLTAESRPKKDITRRDRLIDIQTVCELVGVKKSTIYVWLRDGRTKFPRPVRLGPRMVRWPETAVLQFLQDSINQADSPGEQRE